MKLMTRLPGRKTLSTLLLASATLLCGAVLADQPQTATTAAAAGHQPPVPLLWKASSGERTVYLLGSFHLLKADDYPLSPDGRSRTRRQWCSRFRPSSCSRRSWG